MKKTMIDMENYPRRAHFEYFSSLQNPHMGVTVDADVTELHAFCRRHGYSFTTVFLHAAALAADGVREFRQRIAPEGIVEYDECPTSHTESAGDGTYCYCTLHHHMPFDEYMEYAERMREEYRRRKSFEEEDYAESMYFVSAVPWFRYNDVLQPTAGLRDSNPRIMWCRYEEDFRGRLMMPVSVLCHHALVDGLHIAAFYENLTREMAAITAEKQ